MHVEYVLLPAVSVATAAYYSPQKRGFFWVQRSSFELDAIKMTNGHMPVPKA
jgi:hypothetical protein